MPLYPIIPFQEPTLQCCFTPSSHFRSPPYSPALPLFPFQEPTLHLQLHLRA